MTIGFRQQGAVRNTHSFDRIELRLRFLVREGLVVKGGRRIVDDSVDIGFCLLLFLFVPGNALIIKSRGSFEIAVLDAGCEFVHGIGDPDHDDHGGGNKCNDKDAENDKQHGLEFRAFGLRSTFFLCAGRLSRLYGSGRRGCRLRNSGDRFNRCGRSGRRG